MAETICGSPLYMVSELARRAGLMRLYVGMLKLIDRCAYPPRLLTIPLSVCPVCERKLEV